MKLHKTVVIHLDFSSTLLKSNCKPELDVGWLPLASMEATPLTKTTSSVRNNLQVNTTYYNTIVLLLVLQMEKWSDRFKVQ